ncbi:MAG: hypothetical protein PHD74_02230, partial [Candidatus Krumholzibacteria bacterium]|nr:hypothetical protein [Candidatus Krumholzibacteria bacterium]
MSGISHSAALFLICVTIFATRQGAGRLLAEGVRESDHNFPVVEVAIDKAATLTVWQRYASALKELEGSSDSLRMGIVACYAEQYSRAAELLRCKVDNPYLEWFQLYYLAM